MTRSKTNFKTVIIPRGTIDPNETNIVEVPLDSTRDNVTVLARSQRDLDISESTVYMNSPSKEDFHVVELVPQTKQKSGSKKRGVEVVVLPYRRTTETQTNRTTTSSIPSTSKRDGSCPASHSPVCPLCNHLSSARFMTPPMPPPVLPTYQRHGWCPSMVSARSPVSECPVVNHLKPLMQNYPAGAHSTPVSAQCPAFAHSSPVTTNTLFNTPAATNALFSSPVATNTFFSSPVTTSSPFGAPFMGYREPPRLHACPSAYIAKSDTFVPSCDDGGENLEKIIEGKIDKLMKPYLKKLSRSIQSPSRQELRYCQKCLDSGSTRRYMHEAKRPDFNIISSSFKPKSSTPMTLERSYSDILNTAFSEPKSTNSNACVAGRCPLTNVTFHDKGNNARFHDKGCSTGYKDFTDGLRLRGRRSSSDGSIGMNFRILATSSNQSL